MEQNVDYVQHQVKTIGGKRTERWRSFATEIIGLAGKRPLDKGWADWKGSPEHLANLERRGHNFGLLSRRYPGVDIDVTLPALAGICAELAVEHFGPAPCRTRPGSSKCLLMYRADETLRKRQFVFKDHSGTKHAVELLATGQQYVVDGEHPEGGAYGWNEQPSPWGLETITAARWDEFCRALAERLRCVADVTLVKDGLGGAMLSTSTRRAADPAPEPAVDPIAAMLWWKERHNDEEIRHDKFVELCAAFRGAAGDHADELFDDFRECLPPPRDTEPNTDKTYHSFDSGERLGWSRLCEMTGYMPPDTFEAPLTPEEQGVLETPDPEQVAIDAMLERYAYVRDPDVFFDLETQVPLTSTQFDRSNRLIAPPGSKGTKAAHNIFLRDPRHKRARALTYSPGAPTIVQEELEGCSVDCVNTWRPSSLVPVAGDVTPWLNHAAMLTEPEGPEAMEHLLDCLAFMVQVPGGKLNHAIMLCSLTEGTGKDTLNEPVVQITGAHNVSKITEKDLRSDFNPWLKKELVVVKEVSHLKKEEITGIKGYIAGTPADTVRINEKNMRAFEIPNRQNWILFSNHPDALALSDSDRRFWVCQCTEEKQPEKYFNELYGWYEAGGTAAVAAYLLARDISKFNPKAAPPMTKAKQAMIDLARPEHERWLDEQFAEDGKFARFSTVTVAEITGDWDAPPGLTSRNVPATLRAAGFQAGPYVKLDGKSVPLWLRGRALLAKDNPKLLKEMYAKERTEGGGSEAARGGAA